MNPDFIALSFASVAADPSADPTLLEVDFIGRRSFIHNKRAIGRTKDLADIASLGES